MVGQNGKPLIIRVLRILKNLDKYNNEIKHNFIILLKQEVAKLSSKHRKKHLLLQVLFSIKRTLWYMKISA